MLEFDDPALRSRCDVWCSLDGKTYEMVGTAHAPCTPNLPFQLPFDEGLRGATACFKFCPFDEFGNRTELASAKEHSFTFPNAPELAIIAAHL